MNKLLSRLRIRTRSRQLAEQKTACCFAKEEGKSCTCMTTHLVWASPCDSNEIRARGPARRACAGKVTKVAKALEQGLSVTEIVTLTGSSRASLKRYRHNLQLTA